MAEDLFANTSGDFNADFTEERAFFTASALNECRHSTTPESPGEQFRREYLI